MGRVKGVSVGRSICTVRRVVGVTCAIGALSVAAFGGVSQHQAARTTRQAAWTGHVYPRPTKSRGGALTACPRLRGLQGFTHSVVQKARREVRRFERVSLSYDLAAADAAWRPNVRAAWRHKGLPNHGPEFVLGPPRRIPYSAIVKYSCGRAILSHTITLTTVPGRHHKSYPLGCVACRTTYFLLNRSGHPLIYFVY